MPLLCRQRRMVLERSVSSPVLRITRNAMPMRRRMHGRQLLSGNHNERWAPLCTVLGTCARVGARNVASLIQATATLQAYCYQPSIVAVFEHPHRCSTSSNGTNPDSTPSKATGRLLNCNFQDHSIKFGNLERSNRSSNSFASRPNA